MSITGPLGGSARTAGHGRLRGAPPPPMAAEDGPDMETGLDRMRAAREARLDSIPDPERGDEGTTEAQPWTAEGVGRLVLMTIAGLGAGAIGSTLGRSQQSCAMKLLWVRRGLERLTPAQSGAKGGKGKARKVGG